MDDELRGVKGWLLTFVIILGLVSPAWSAFRVYQEFHTGAGAALGDIPLFVQLKTYVWITIAVRAVIGWIAVYRLLTVFNWRSVQIAIGAVWLISVGGAIAQYAGLTWITGLQFSDVMAEVGPRGILTPLGFALIWTAYLLKSERVANTYRDPGEQADVFE